jgi:hypothetical protein
MFVTKNLIGMLQLQEWISEPLFGSTAEMGGYANMSLNIPKLSDTAALVCIGR